MLIIIIIIIDTKSQISQISGYDSVNSNISSRVRKVARDGADVTSGGRQFQTWGPKTEMLGCCRKSEVLGDLEGRQCKWVGEGTTVHSHEGPCVPGWQPWTGVTCQRHSPFQMMVHLRDHLGKQPPTELIRDFNKARRAANRRHPSWVFVIQQLPSGQDSFQQFWWLKFQFCSPHVWNSLPLHLRQDVNSRVSSINWKHFCLGVSQPWCIVTALLCYRNTHKYLLTYPTYLLTTPVQTHILR